MQLKTVVLGAGVGVIFSSAVAMAVPIDQRSSLTNPPVTTVTATPEPARAHMTAGGTLVMDARLGHASMARGSTYETYLFATVTGVDGSTVSTATAAPPLDLAIVVDRSGSMKGDRIAKALAAAITAVERMRDGDNVVVVTFDTEAQVVVPSTTINAGNRSNIIAAIRSIRLGGDTCISCGLEEARAQFDRVSTGSNHVRRIMLLSDGATNNGIRDVPGLRALATRMRDRGCAITTIGVDVDFDEKVMTALATESNGNHYFVATAGDLPSVFSKEFDSLVGTIAREGSVTIEPAPGVELQDVVDRPFRREGKRIIVPLGSFSAKDEKSILLKVRVPSENDGVQPVADLKLTYQDLLERGTDRVFDGSLSVLLRSDGLAQKELDPFVLARVERSTTARALSDANDLVNQGRFDDARRRLENRSAELQNAQARAPKALAGPAPSLARGFGQDFDDQNKALDTATKATKAKPDTRGAKEAPKKIASELLTNPFR